MPPAIPHEAPERDAGTLEISFASADAAPAHARDEITAWLVEGSIGGTVIDDARLLVSELVTNCVRHARITPDQPLRLSASRREAVLRMELHDDGTDGEVARRASGQGDDPGGFGLNLVALLSSAWGVERDANGTTVWVELATGSRTS